MKFKNYRNRYNRRNQIISEEEFLDMPLQKIFDKENDILAQYNQIGLPTNEELSASPNTQFVSNSNNEDNGWYVKSDGSDLVSDLDKSNPILQGIIEYNKVIPNADEEVLPISHSQSEELQSKEPPSKQPVNTQKSQTTSIPGVNNIKSMSNPVTPEIMLPAYFDLGLMPDLGKVKATNSPINKDISNSYNSKSNNDLMHQLYLKYGFLSPVSALQKAGSKIAINLPLLQYYGHSAHLADGEEPSQYMQEQNELLKYSDLPDSDFKERLKYKAAKMLDVDVNDPDLNEKIKNVDVVIPKANSDLHNLMKQSDTVQKWVYENIDDIKKQREVSGYVEFPLNETNLFGIIHKANVDKAQDNNLESFKDIYDFLTMEKKKYPTLNKNLAKYSKDAINTLIYNKFVDANNNAVQQQDFNQIQNYLLSPLLSFSDEELEEIIKKYRK